MRKLFLVIAMFVLTAPLVYAAGASGTSWDPFDGNWAPEGTHAILFYYKYNSADTQMVDGDDAMKGINYDSSITVARWNTWQQIGSVPFQVSVIVPFANVDMAAGPVSMSASGIGDPGLITQFKITDWEGGYFNAGMSVYFPIGRYSPDRLSVGKNRWALRPSMTLSQTFGRFRVDFISALEFYTDNSDYKVGYTGNKTTLEKDMALFSDLHLSYMLDPTSNTYAALSLGCAWLGEETVNSVNSNEAADYVGRFSLGTNFNQTTSIILSVHHDIKVENGPRGWGGQIRFAKAF